MEAYQLLLINTLSQFVTAYNTRLSMWRKPIKGIYLLVFLVLFLIKYNLYVFLFVNFISVVIFKSSSYNSRICQIQSNFSRFSSDSVVFFFLLCI